MGVLFFAISVSIDVLLGALYKVDAIRSKFTCQNDFMYIKCLSPKVIKIFYATYSRKDDNICKGWKNDGNSAEYCAPVDKTRFLQKLCEGHTECNVAVDTDSMGNKCPNISALKYLNVIYNCGKLFSYTLTHQNEMFVDAAIYV